MIVKGVRYLPFMALLIPNGSRTNEIAMQMSRNTDLFMSVVEDVASAEINVPFAVDFNFS